MNPEEQGRARPLQPAATVYAEAWKARCHQCCSSSEQQNHAQGQLTRCILNWHDKLMRTYTTSRRPGRVFPWCWKHYQHTAGQLHASHSISGTHNHVIKRIARCLQWQTTYAPQLHTANKTSLLAVLLTSFNGLLHHVYALRMLPSCSTTSLALPRCGAQM